MEIRFKPTFVRKYKTLDPDLQEEIKDKVSLLKNPSNHQLLKVHKLKGQLKKYYSFSINYRIRIVFEYSSKTEITLLVVGDHNVYK